MILPNVFIIGAPKCGTTSIYHWLNEHSEVSVCVPKEPSFFSSDMSIVGRVVEWGEYSRLFSSFNNTKIIVDASTTYLRSQVALQKIEECCVSPKYIICLRNPYEMAQSIHAQLLKTGRENIADFNSAWRAQYLRKNGLQLPYGCSWKDDLLYAENSKIGTQVKRVAALIPNNRILYLFLDDIASKPDLVYEDLLGFLGLSHEGFVSFGSYNRGSVPRSIVFARILYYLFALKTKVLGNRSLFIGRIIQNITSKNASNLINVLDEDVKKDMVKIFNDEISIISNVTGRDLSAWNRF